MYDMPLTKNEYLELDALIKKAQDIYLNNMGNPVTYLDVEDAERYQNLINRWNNK